MESHVRRADFSHAKFQIGWMDGVDGAEAYI